MILDVPKNQVINANQVPQFLQTARILNCKCDMSCTEATYYNICFNLSFRIWVANELGFETKGRTIKIMY